MTRSTPFLAQRAAAVAAMCLAALLAAGCAPMATYNPAYVQAPVTPAAEKLAGKALVYTLASDDDTPYVGPPTSFTGSATKLTIPLNLIAREIAATVFGDLFRDGAVKAGTLDAAAAYRVVVHPKVVSFSYEYNQLKNLGFAITPTVVLSLDLSLLDRTGQVLQQRRYDSGTVEGPAYMMSGEPGEQIGKVAHGALLDLMRRAAADLRAWVHTSSGGPVAL